MVLHRIDAPCRDHHSRLPFPNWRRAGCQPWGHDCATQRIAAARLHLGRTCRRGRNAATSSAVSLPRERPSPSVGPGTAHGRRRAVAVFASSSTEWFVEPTRWARPMPWATRSPIGCAEPWKAACFPAAMGGQCALRDGARCPVVQTSLWERMTRDTSGWPPPPRILVRVTRIVGMDYSSQHHGYKGERGTSGLGDDGRIRPRSMPIFRGAEILEDEASIDPFAGFGHNTKHDVSFLGIFLP